MILNQSFLLLINTIIDYPFKLTIDMSETMVGLMGYEGTQTYHAISILNATNGATIASTRW
jgi:hypothetical protein